MITATILLVIGIAKFMKPKALVPVKVWVPNYRRILTLMIWMTRYKCNGEMKTNDEAMCTYYYIAIDSVGFQSQVPMGIRYQAVARDEMGALITEQNNSMALAG